MSLSEKEIKHIAKLACIDISEKDMSKLQTDLEEILNYVAKLNEINTDNVEPTSHVHGLVNAFREDLTWDSLSFEKLSVNSPSITKLGYKVPKII